MCVRERKRDDFPAARGDEFGGMLVECQTRSLCSASICGVGAGVPGCAGTTHSDMTHDNMQASYLLRCLTVGRFDVFAKVNSLL